MALSAVLKVLKHGLISEENPDAAEAMHAVADAVTLCRFEATDPDHDDVVLSKILHVLLECMRCPTGHLLSDDDVCNIVQACYRIGHQSGKESALLRNLSRHVLREIVHETFRRLPTLPALAQGHAHHIDAPRPPPNLESDPEEKVDAPESESAAEDAAAEHAGAAENAGAADSSTSHDAVAPKSPTKGPGAESDPAGDGTPFAADPSPHGEPFGLACVLEIFRFSASFISLEDGGDENAESMCAFGLQLVLASLESAGDDFARHPPLLRLVQDELSRAILAVAPAGHPPVLAAVAAAVLQLYMVMHLELKLQLEAFLRMVLLPLAEGRGEIPKESQRVALECIVDLCRQPAFVPDLYMNFDCDVERPNLFEELVSLLSRGAFPQDGAAFDATHLLSLEGLLAITAGIADRSAAVPPAGKASADAEANEEEEEEEEVGGEIWDRLASGGARETETGGVARAKALRRNRRVKRRLLACADHFNRSHKKGLAYMQEIKLLPDPLEAAAVARFLKHAPRLDKEVVGEYLGDHKDFNVEVLTEYCGIFDFRGVTLDKALRTFLDGFKLPGEAQKISRILEVFAARYYGANPGAVADADSAYVLSYSIIMLNTDQHNPQVKRKMTLDQFIRNNRGTNGGADWPRETLENIFRGIVEDEIKLTDDAAPTLTPSRWADMMRQAERGRGRMMSIPEMEEACLYDADLFTVVWRPAVAAASVVFDHAVDESVLREALDGFLGVARVAGHHRLTEVMDHLVATLCKFAAPAHVVNAAAAAAASGGSARPSARFGDDDRARTAAVTAFTVANRYGDALREGWGDIVDLILRLREMDVLSEKVLAALSVDERDGGPMRAFDGSTASTSAKAEKLQKKPSGGSSLLRGFSQLLSLESDAWGGGGGETPPTEAEKEAEARATRCVEACRVDEIFADSKFLEAESLAALAAALVRAAGFGTSAAVGRADTDTDGDGVVGETDGAAAVARRSSPPARVDDDAALFCLDVLVGVALRNRDRVRVVLPHVYGVLRAVVQGAKTPGPLPERAIFELLRICQRLLPYEEDLAEELLDSLRLLFALEPAVADAHIERVARELRVLVRVAGPHISSAKGWDTVCKLLMASARHPDAAPHGFDALSRIVLAEDDAENENGNEFAAKRHHVAPWNVRACVEATSAFVDAHQGGDERSVAALALLSATAQAIGEWCDGVTDGGAAAAAAAATTPEGCAARNSSAEALAALRAEMLAGPWSDIVDELRRVVETEERPAVRDDAVLTLQRVLLASDGLNAPPSHWAPMLETRLLPTLVAVGEGCRRARGGGEARAAAERTAHLAVSCVAKTFLARLPAMLQTATPARFAAAWGAALDAMEGVAKTAQTEELREAVPEAVKNMLLVMSAQGVLAPGAPEGLWETTWKRAATIDEGLTPAIVGAK